MHPTTCFSRQRRSSPWGCWRVSGHRCPNFVQARGTLTTSQHTGRLLHALSHPPASTASRREPHDGLGVGIRGHTGPNPSRCIRRLASRDSGEANRRGLAGERPPMPKFCASEGDAHTTTKTWARSRLPASGAFHIDNGGALGSRTRPTRPRPDLRGRREGKPVPSSARGARRMKARPCGSIR